MLKEKCCMKYLHLEKRPLEPTLHAGDPPLEEEKKLCKNLIIDNSK